MLKLIALYMLLNMFNYVIILSALFEIQSSAVRKVILDYFLWSKFILLILKNQNIVRCYCDAAIYLLALEPLVPSQMGFCGVSCLLGEVI